jgi:gamma-glutamylcyclotransferase
MMIYFAYGSNLCLARFVTRVPSARFVTQARLPQVRLVFHKRGDDGSGKATLVPAADAAVYGALLTLEDADLPALRRAEGYPEHYSERMVTVTTSRGTPEAITYFATDRYLDPSQLPYDWYVDLVCNGASQVGLPENCIAQLDGVARKTDPDQSRAARERAFLRRGERHADA